MRPCQLPAVNQRVGEEKDGRYEREHDLIDSKYAFTSETEPEK